MGLAGSISMLVTAEAVQDVMPVVTDTVTTLPTSEEYAEITMLRGKYFGIFVSNIINFFFFLAQIAAMTRELQASQEAAAADTAPASVERPTRLENLQEAMSIQSNDNCTYRVFCVSPVFILTKRVGV
jgi:hypothetical protein